MKKLHLTLVCLVTAIAVEAQVGIKGLWGISAVGKPVMDTIFVLDRDSTISDSFPGHFYYYYVADKIFGTDTTIGSMKRSNLFRYSSMFIQFDGNGRYGEGLDPMSTGEPLRIKRGKYEENGGALRIKMRTRKSYQIRKRGIYLTLTDEKGIVLYLVKISEELY